MSLPKCWWTRVSIYIRTSKLIKIYSRLTKEDLKIVDAMNVCLQSNKLLIVAIVFNRVSIDQKHLEDVGLLNSFSLQCALAFGMLESLLPSLLSVSEENQGRMFPIAATAGCGQGTSSHLGTSNQKNKSHKSHRIFDNCLMS